MSRRWLIRCFLIALCVICIGVWVESYWRSTEVVLGNNIHGHWIVILGLSNGMTVLCLDRASGLPPPGWFYYYTLSTPSSPVGLARFFAESYAYAPFHLLGFSYHSALKCVTIPLWFPTLLSASLLWFAGRKTERKPTGGAFPIEPLAKSK